MSQIVIKRTLDSIGWIDKLNFIDLETGKPLKLRSYNGCLCFILNGKRIGYNTFKNKSIESNIIVDNSCPF